MYESLRSINLELNGLQNQFQQHYSKIGNTRENYFMHGDHFILMKKQKH